MKTVKEWIEEFDEGKEFWSEYHHDLAYMLAEWACSNVIKEAEGENCYMRLVKAKRNLLG